MLHLKNLKLGKKIDCINLGIQLLYSFFTYTGRYSVKIRNKVTFNSYFCVIC